MTKITEEQKRRVEEALANDEPIPLGPFLASWSEDVMEGVEPVGLAEMLDPKWREHLLTSQEFAHLKAAAEGWVTRNHNRRRPELARKERSSKQVGSFLEGELREAIEEAFGRELGGSAAKGVDIQGIRVDIKTTRVTHPQSSAPVKEGDEPAVGLDCHILLLVYELDNDGDPDAPRLQVASLTFIPRWMT